MTGYAPAGNYFLPSLLITFINPDSRSLGYITDPTQFIRGLSPLHDSGTGSSVGEHSTSEVPNLQF